jgi:hypothetical protein
MKTATMTAATTTKGASPSDNADVLRFKLQNKVLCEFGQGHNSMAPTAWHHSTQQENCTYLSTLSIGMVLSAKALRKAQWPSLVGTMNTTNMNRVCGTSGDAKNNEHSTVAIKKDLCWHG